MIVRDSDGASVLEGSSPRNGFGFGSRCGLARQGLALVGELRMSFCCFICFLKRPGMSLMLGVVESGRRSNFETKCKSENRHPQLWTARWSVKGFGSKGVLLWAQG